MKANELIAFSLGLMGESSEAVIDYSDYSIPAINVILAECFDVNNSLLKAQGIPPLSDIVQISGLSDDIKYDNKLLITCLSYGLAAKLILEDNDMNKFNYFNQMYIQGMISNYVCDNVSIEDIYGGDCI